MDLHGETGMNRLGLAFGAGKTGRGCLDVCAIRLLSISQK